MVKKRLLTVIIFAAACALPLEAQTGTGVFAPYVTQLQGEIRNKLVRLSWVDSIDVQGPVYLYRSVNPFSTDIYLPGGIEIPYGIQSFVDEIESGITYYYFAAASDESGRHYNNPIPYSNTIAIHIAEDDSSSPPYVSETLPIEYPPFLPQGISSLEAMIQDDRVIISFSQGGTGSTALYRSVRPIRQMSDLLGAIIVGTRVSSPFVDFPIPGIPYYYAAISEEDLTRGTISITPGKNATLSAVEVSPAGLAASNNGLRAMPLPQISVQAAAPGFEVYSNIPPAMELSPQAAKALGSIPSPQMPSPVQKKARVFARDMEEIPIGSDDHILSTIVKGPFALKNWETARDELRSFLALPRNPEASARARFYLGQCWYFLMLPREGLFEFLSIQDKYPYESMEWIQASLDMMKKQGSAR